MRNVDKEDSVGFPRRLKYLSVLVSAICISLIIIHAIFPQDLIDTTTVALLIVLIFPWLLPYIKTIKLPGGAELILKEDLLKAKQLIKNSPAFIQASLKTSGTSSSLPDGISFASGSGIVESVVIAPTRSALLKNDPNLALASLRIEIESKLREKAKKENLPVAEESLSLEKVLYELYSKNVVGSPEFDILSIIIDACDRAVHSERIDFVTASQIVEIGESAISYIESLPEKSESANKTPGKGKKLTPGGNDF